MSTEMDDTDFTTAFYFTRSTVAAVAEASILDRLSMGEVELVSALLPYAAAFAKLADKTIIEESEHDLYCPGVFDYEVSDDRAGKLMLVLIQLTAQGRTMTLPDMNVFKDSMKLMIIQWMKGENDEQLPSGY